MHTLELAKLEEIHVYCGIIEDGKRFQKEQGFVQWTEDYPNMDTIREDIREKRGYALKIDGCIAGYMCIDFAGEPAYDSIEGKWRSDASYAVVHRMAFSKDFRGMGLADIAFQLVEKLCLENKISYIRVDTDFPNQRMQHSLTKNGFENCGVIVFQGSGKLAYDKLL